ncbi:MAG: hypothetical protein K8R68_03325 [Bacteroidales bacterium]|nr:hypothetical protein [Bacteroidales bacterium]
MKNLILTLLISSFLITASTAQELSNSKIPKIKKWSVAMYIGNNAGGPSKQIEEAMIANGFDDHREPGWINLGNNSGTDYPYSENFQPSLLMSIKYYLKAPYAIGIVGGYTKLGSTHGYKIDNFGHYLYIDYSAYNISSIFSYNLYDIVKIGIGPSVYFTKAWESYDHPEGDNVEYKHTKVGFLVDFGLRIPKKTLFFFELKGQYKYVGKAEIGPFNENPYRDELPKTKVNYNHLFIGVGFGVRL